MECCYKNDKGEPCQFSEELHKREQKIKQGNNISQTVQEQKLFYVVNDKEYCIFHLPLSEKKKWRGRQIEALYYCLNSIYNLNEPNSVYYGIEFRSFGPPNNYKTDANRKKIGDHNSYVTFNSCVLDSYIHIESAPTTKWERSIFTGDVFFATPLENVNFDDCIFEGMVDFNTRIPNPHITSTSFTHCVFKRQISFEGLEFKCSIDFEGSHFQDVVDFTDSKFPQDTNFEDVVFDTKAIHYKMIPSYRTVMMAMKGNGSRLEQGRFFRIINDCEIARHNNYTLNRAFNQIKLIGTRYNTELIPPHVDNFGDYLRKYFRTKVLMLYKYSSGYGTSYESATKWLLLIQLAFMFIYIAFSFCFENFSNPIIFTLSQIFKPFEILSQVKPITFSDHCLVDFAVKFTATVHSIITITLFALLLLALRWRFKKD